MKNVDKIVALLTEQLVKQDVINDVLNGLQTEMKKVKMKVRAVKKQTEMNTAAIGRITPICHAPE